MIENLLLLLFCHALADFALQSDVMAKGKNITLEKQKKEKWIADGRDPTQFRKTWFYWLWSHATIQGGLIGVLTGNWWIALFEMVAHFLIDFAKTNNKTNIHQDQAMHFSLRLLYWIILEVV